MPEPSVQRTRNLRCTGCGETVKPEDIIQSGVYSGGHLRLLSAEASARCGYGEDPCGPVEEVDA